MKLCVKRLRKAIGALAALACFGTATALADSINLSEVTENTIVADGETLTGTLGANVKISIADGATVTLKDVTITNLGKGCHWAGINCPGDAILVLEGANTVCAGGNSSGYHNYPGIWIAPEKTLTIQGDGSLTAYSGTGNAAWGSGIGGGYEIDCGNIVIEGGAITATGGKSAAGSPRPAANPPPASAAAIMGPAATSPSRAARSSRPAARTPAPSAAVAAPRAATLRLPQP